MPLSAPAAEREPIHTRAIECSSYRRSDGLWDIEGHLTDVKAYPFFNDFRGEIVPGEPLHDMWLRLTVDSDFVVQAVEVTTDKGPYEICPAILPQFQKLKGLMIGPGWNRRVRENLGGSHGCAHLVDLLRPLATVAFHSVRWSASAPANSQKAEQTRGGTDNAGNNDTSTTDRADKRLARPPLNTCHVWASDGEKIHREYPEFFTGKDS